MRGLKGTYRRRVSQGLAVVLALAPSVLAQQPTPRIGYVFPAGGKQGSIFQVAVGGQFLENVGDAHFSGAGITATVIDHTKPLTPQQFNTLREKLKELLDRKTAAARESGTGRSQATTKPAWTDDDEKTLADIGKKLANPPNRQGNPAIAETVTLQVTIDPDADPGERELRLAAPSGLTNPLVFGISQLPEFTEQEPKERNDPNSGKTAKPGKQPNARSETKAPASPPEMSIILPAVVNGQIMPGDVDRYRFKARKGQRLVVDVAARALVPYLPDAVPGWFQATLALYDAKGKEVAYDDDYRFHPDPVLFFQIPMNGEYVIEIKDAIYRGREDFVYRIAIGELPFVTSIFPLGGKAGDQPSVEVKGWNLPVDRLTVDARDRKPGVRPLTVSKGQLVSNLVPFEVSTLPECLEQEPNNQPDRAQSVKLPIIVNGHVGTGDDSDMFRFEGRAGQEVVAEVVARRLDSPLDSVLKLTDANGRQLALNDDHEDKGTGLNTHHADSWLRATLPIDGTYYIHLSDAQNKGGPEYSYRLRISPPMPDFELRVVPSNINVRGGASATLTVHALRKDGFADEISLALKNAPPGFRLGGARVPASQDKVQLTLTVPPAPLREPLSLSMEGRATIQGQQVVRSAVPAEDMMQAFAYRHLVPAKELIVTVSGRGMQRNSLRILSAMPVRIPAGGTARVQVSAPANTPLGQVQLELSEPPDGITIQRVSPIDQGTEIMLQCDAKKVKPGLRGNLIINAFLEKSAASDNAKPPGNKRRTPAGSLPAIPFEIVGEK